MKKMSHIDDSGAVTMVNISEKKESQRFALARCLVLFPEEVMRKLSAEKMNTHKGSVLQAATIAGIMAAKKTSELIPLCHPMGLDSCELKFKIQGNEIIIDCAVGVFAKTGVEMEALIGATLAALTIYDMCKSMSHDIIIKETILIQKTGGKNDFKRK